MLRILTVDDHAVVRDGVKRIFDEGTSAAVFGEAGTFQEALKLVEEQDWDVVVLDITLRGRNGLELLKRAETASAKAFNSDPQYAFRGTICAESFQGRRRWLRH